MSAFRLNPTLPVELVHKIITLVVADSVHSVCTSGDRLSDYELTESPKESNAVLTWDINALTHLSGVCRQFKDICSDIAVKIFLVERAGLIEDGVNPVPLVAQKLRDLHYVTHHMNEPSRHETVPLITPFLAGYRVYSSLRNLFHHGIRATPEKLKYAMKHAATSIAEFRELQKTLWPREMGAVLNGGVLELELLCSSSLNIVVLADNVCNGLVLLGADGLSVDQKENVVQSLHKSLSAIEILDDVYTILITENAWRGVLEKIVTRDIPSIYPALSRLSTTPLLSDSEASECSLRIRTNVILAGWAEHEGGEDEDGEASDEGAGDEGDVDDDDEDEDGGDEDDEDGDEDTGGDDDDDEDEAG